MGEPLRAVIAEDNYLVREGLRRLLEDSGEVAVLACVGSAPELLDAVGRLAPEVVLTDIRMPPGHHMEGIEAAHAIRAEHPGTGVVVLSQHTDDSYAMALFADGWPGWATSSRTGWATSRTSSTPCVRYAPEAPSSTRRSWTRWCAGDGRTRRARWWP